MHIFCDRNSFTIDSSSCLPSIRISEVHPRGKYIRIINASQSQEEDLGNHFLLQRYQDTPFTVFRFPSSVRLPPQGVDTVWSASGAAEECCAGRQLPPTDFIFSSQPIWASGPDCITILCKPNEQALKWLSSSPSLAKRSEESPSGGFGPSSLKKHKSLQQPQQQQKTKSYVVYNAGLEEQSSAFKDVDPVKECQSKAASGAKDEIRREEKKSARGEERRRPQVDCSQTSDSSPDRRRTLTLVERKRGVAAADEEDVERRRRTGEARKRKKKSVKVDSRKEKEAEAEAEVEEEECPGCGEEIRRRRKKSEQAKEKEEEKEEEEKRTKNRGDKEEDFWKVTTIMDRKIPCTIVHIEDQPTTSPTVAATRRKSKDRGKEGKGGKEGGGGKGKGGGGRGECDEERSECGEERDCGETNRPNSIGNNFNSLINSKNSICAMSDSNQDDNDCCDREGGGGGGGGGCGSESPRQKKRLSDGSLGRCIESRDGSSKGGSSCCTMKECKDRKEARNGAGAGGGAGGGGRRGGGGGGRAREDGYCEEEDEDEEDDCDRKRKERKVVPCRKSKCDECMDSKSRKKDEDEAVQEKWIRPNACAGKGGCGAGGGGGGRGKEGGKGVGGGACGGEGGKRRTSKECKDDEDCCESGEESNWTKWTKWLAGLVNSRRSSSSQKGGDSGHRGDQPPSTVDCLDDQMRSVGDTEVRCIDQVHVRERCPTYRPRLAKGAQCRCPDGCPACPPRKPDCSEEVGIMERSRQRTMKTKKMQSADDCDCDGSAQRRQQKRDATKCDYDEEGEGGGGSSRISRSDGCLREGGGSQLDSMALTAASVMAAGLTVAAIYCH